MPHETLAPQLETLLTGHFCEGVGYQTWRARGTSDDLLIYTLSGVGRFGYAGGVHCSSPGELVLLRSGTPHDYATKKLEPRERAGRAEPAEASQGHWELLWTHFRPRAHWSAWMNWPRLAPGLLHLQLESPRREQVEKILLEMHAQAIGGSSHRDQWAMNALEQVWLACLPAGFERGLDERVIRALEYIRSHLGEGLTLGALAEHCHLSVSRLSHLFAEQVGQSPMAFLEGERCARAAQLLTLTSLSVSSIALEVGYPDPLYFSRRFRARMHQSPRQFREGTLERESDPA